MIKEKLKLVPEKPGCYLMKNKDNQIIFQQDFWDPANGLYRQLPYVGGAYSWLLAFKKSS